MREGKGSKRKVRSDSTAQYNTAQYSAIQYNIIYSLTIQYSTIQINITQFNKVRENEIQDKIGRLNEKKTKKENLRKISKIMRHQSHLLIIANPSCLP